MEKTCYHTHTPRMSIETENGVEIVLHDVIDEQFIVLNNKEFCQVLMGMLQFFDLNRDIMPDDFKLELINTHKSS